MPGSRRRLLALLVLLPMGLALVCGGFQTIVVDEPRVTLIDDPAIQVAARVGGNFVKTSVQVRLDGVDLIAALGLTPPFFAASGAVLVGSDLVTVSGFSFDSQVGPMTIDLALAGLSPGTHAVAVQGTRSGDGQPFADTASFQVVDGFALAAEVVPAAAIEEPETSGAEGTLFGASFGEPFASEPVALTGGGTLRQGFVEVSEALIAGGTP